MCCDSFIVAVQLSIYDIFVYMKRSQDQGRASKVQPVVMDISLRAITAKIHTLPIVAVIGILKDKPVFSAVLLDSIIGTSLTGGS